MATKNLYIPENVSHPGTTLEEKMKEMGMSVKEFAVRTSKPEKTVIAIIKGDSSITPEMAVAFENVTKIPANFWMNRQRNQRMMYVLTVEFGYLSTNGIICIQTP